MNLFEFLGVAGAGSVVYHRHQYDSWVRTYVAQGMTVAAAEVAACQAMGLSAPPGTPTSGTYTLRTIGALLVAALFVGTAFMHLGGGATLAVLIFAGFAIWRALANATAALDAAERTPYMR